MRKTIGLTLSLTLTIATLTAQYVSPGNGSNLTITNLVDLSSGVVTQQNGKYVVTNDITISDTDTLTLVTNDTILFSQGNKVTIKGTLICNPPQRIVFRALDTTQHFKGFSFENSEGSKLNNASIEFAGGNKISESEVTITNTVFYKNDNSHRSGAIDLIASSPTIKNCIFKENALCAISSGVNSLSSPTILNCTFYKNCTSNENRPQINLGTGGNDTIVIRKNTIIGESPRSGAIAIFSLSDNTPTKTVIDSNAISNNRYGINIQGKSIYYKITNNQIIDNNIETNPMQGGSGISLNGSVIGIISKNKITGNLWGITILNGAEPNIGEISPSNINEGRNHIYNNGNNNQTYNLYNNTNKLIKAQNNYWGTNDPEVAEQGIFHHPDNNTLGQVEYIPILIPSNNNEITQFSLSDGTHNAVGDINGDSIIVQFTSNIDLTNLIATYTVHDHAVVQVNDITQISGQTSNNFTTPVIYTVIAEDGTTRHYTVKVSIATSIKAQATTATISPNPISRTVTISNTTIIKSISIYGQYGNLVDTYLIGATQAHINFEHIEQGVYLLLIETDNNITTEKVIISR